MPETLNGLLTQTEPITQAQLTPEIIQAITRELQGLSLSERENALRELLTRAQTEAQDEITALRASIENPDEVAEYSLEALIVVNEGNEQTQAFIEMYQSQIASDLSEIYGPSYEQLTETGKSTVELVFWNIIESQLNMSSAVRIGIGQITDVTEMFQGIFPGTEGDAQEQNQSIITQLVRQRFAGYGENLLTPELQADMETTLDLVDSLIGAQANRLQTLFTQLEEQNISLEARNQIFENPQVLAAILDEGMYEGQGFSINLTVSPAEFRIGNISESERMALREDFMEELIESSQNLSGGIDRIRSLAERADGFLQSIGFENGIQEFTQMLEEIPIIGFIFKILFGDFFGQFDQVENFEAAMRAVEALQNPEQALAMGNFYRNFLPALVADTDHTDHPLTVLQQENPISPEFSSNLSQFFTTLSQVNNHSEGTQNDIRINNTHFWSRIMMGEENPNSYEQVIFEKVQAAYGETNFSEASLVRVLNAIDIGVFEVSITPNEEEITVEETIVTAEGTTTFPEAEVSTSPDNESQGDPQVTDPETVPEPSGETEVPIVPETPREIPPLVDQISTLSSLPASIILESGEVVEISPFDSTTSSFRIGERRFQVGEFQITFPPLPAPITALSIDTTGAYIVGSLNGVEQRVDINPTQFTEILESLLQTGNYTFSNTQGELTISEILE